MYSFGNIFKQEPNAVSAVFLAGLNFLTAVHAFGINLTDIQIGLGNTFLLLVLNLFYARPLTASKDGLRELGSKKKS